MDYLYECSQCGGPVKVTTNGNCEPTKHFECGHNDAVIWANRKVILCGVGNVSASEKVVRSIKLNLRQMLSILTGRSI